jgi:hypothetical protein
VSPAEQVLWDLWLGTFAARTDAFVVDSARTVRHPLTPDVCERAASSGHAISGYLAVRASDSEPFTTHVGGIDVDTNVDDALTIQTFLTEHGINTLLALSRRGAHLWTWTHGDGLHGTERYMPINAATVRAGLQAGVNLAITDPEVREHIEVFPKASDSAFGVGALRMPLFKHPKTGLVYDVVGPDGKPSSDRLEVYNWATEVHSPVEALRRLAGAIPAHVAYPTALGPQRRPSPQAEGPGVAALLHRKGLDVTPGKTAARCPFHDDKHGSLSVAKDDQRIWCKAPTCPAYNGGRGLGSLALAKLVGA